MIQNLQKKLEFIELMDQMKNIERAILLKNRRQESNADHSFHLAMMVIVFAEDFPQLDTYKCVKLALIHDLVEIYAGDTIVLDIEHEKTKEERERAAVYKFAAEFGNNIFEGLIDLMNDYEEKNSAESKFVYSLDKVQPIIQVVNEGGETWEKWKIGYEKIKARQYKKIYPEFGLDKILDIYFKKAEQGNMQWPKK